MRYVGRISKWNDDRGYGFVTPNGGGDEAFVHIKAFERRSIRPSDGTLISYEPSKDAKGRLNAAAVRLVGQKGRRKTADFVSWPKLALAVTSVIALVIGWAAAKIPTLIMVAYAAASALAFVFYGVDKSAAVNNRWRTSESTLHFLASAGGWPGALLAQEVFRHKSKKTAFRAVFWFTVFLNCMVLAWLLYTGKGFELNQSILRSMAGQ